MTQTLIYTIPYSKHYTGFTQNNITYFSPTSFLLSLSHPTIPTLTPPQHSINTEANSLQTFKRPPHEQDNTNTLVEKAKNRRGK
jgi:hypothetical protein